MRREHSGGYGKISFWAMAAIFLGVLIGAPAAFGQFGLPKLPKIPKIGKQERKPPARPKQPQAPMPEVNTIAPDSVPPGWEGDVVFTGQNFTKTMGLRMGCMSFSPEDFKVESAERAVVHLKVPRSAEDATCAIALGIPPEGLSAETGPLPDASLEIVQVKSATFGISQSSNLPVAVSACFLDEGELSFAQLGAKFAQMMNTSSQDECKLLVSAGGVKYAKVDKTILDQPASAINWIRFS